MTAPLLLAAAAVLGAVPRAHAASVTAAPGDDLATFFSGAAAGDEIVLSPGVYEISSTLTISEVASTEAAPLRIRGEEGAVIKLVANEEGAYASPLIRVQDSSHVELSGFALEGADSWATDLDNGYNGLQLNNVSSVLIDGLTIQELTRSAVLVQGMSSDVTVMNTEIQRIQAGHGIYVGCSDVSCFTTGFTATTNLIHDLGGETYAISLQHGTQGALLVDNIVYNLEYRGFEAGSTELGEPTTMEGNAIWSAGDIAVVLRGAALVRNNVIFNITGRGIVARDPERGTYTDQIIVYNTIVDTDDWGIDAEGWQADMGFILANNAVCSPLRYGVRVTKTVREDQDPEDVPTPARATMNLVCGLVEGPDAELGEVVAGGGYDDFSDVELWDFYPTPDALLIDAADPSGNLYPPELDFNGTVRDGEAPEVGAYEYVGEGNPGWSIREDFKEYVEVEEEAAGGDVAGGCCKDGKEGSEEALFLVLPLLGLGAVRRRRNDRP